MKLGGWLKLLVALVAVALMLAAAIWFVGSYVEKRLSPDPDTIVSSSLVGLREQNRLVTFQADYVAVVTSSQCRMLGTLCAKETMILPGAMRYEVDMAKLQQKDVRWDASAKRLTVTLPPVEVVGPAIDLNKIVRISGGGVLMKVSDVEKVLDAANQKAAQASLVTQAHATTPMRLARDSARRAVEHSFAMPLKAAGVDAEVKVRFADEPAPSNERWDESRRPEDVINNKW